MSDSLLHSIDDLTLVGHCGVDSGQIFIVDPCYVFTDNFNSEGLPTGLPYDEICRVTTKNTVGQAAMGVATSTLYGDGIYPVYVHKIGDKVSSIHVFFDDIEELYIDD